MPNRNAREAPLWSKALLDTIKAAVSDGLTDTMKVDNAVIAASNVEVQKKNTIVFAESAYLGNSNHYKYTDDFIRIRRFYTKIKAGKFSKESGRPITRARLTIEKDANQTEIRDFIREVFTGSARLNPKDHDIEENKRTFEHISAIIRMSDDQWTNFSNSYEKQGEAYNNIHTIVSTIYKHQTGNEVDYSVDENLGSGLYNGDSEMSLTQILGEGKRFYVMEGESKKQFKERMLNTIDGVFPETSLNQNVIELSNKTETSVAYGAGGVVGGEFNFNPNMRYRGQVDLKDQTWQQVLDSSIDDFYDSWNGVNAGIHLFDHNFTDEAFDIKRALEANGTHNVHVVPVYGQASLENANVTLSSQFKGQNVEVAILGHQGTAFGGEKYGIVTNGQFERSVRELWVEDNIESLLQLSVPVNGLFGSNMIEEDGKFRPKNQYELKKEANFPTFGGFDKNASTGGSVLFDIGSDDWQFSGDADFGGSRGPNTSINPFMNGRIIVNGEPLDLDLENIPLTPVWAERLGKDTITKEELIAHKNTFGIMRSIFENTEDAGGQLKVGARDWWYNNGNEVFTNGSDIEFAAAWNAHPDLRTLSERFMTTDFLTAEMVNQTRIGTYFDKIYSIGANDFVWQAAFDGFTDNVTVDGVYVGACYMGKYKRRSAAISSIFDGAPTYGQSKQWGTGVLTDTPTTTKEAMFMAKDGRMMGIINKDNQPERKEYYDHPIFGWNMDNNDGYVGYKYTINKIEDEHTLGIRINDYKVSTPKDPISDLVAPTTTTPESTGIADDSWKQLYQNALNSITNFTGD